MSDRSRVRWRRGARPSGSAGPYRRYSRRELAVIERIRSAYELLSLPIVTLFLFHDKRFHRAYGLTWRKKLRLAHRMYRNTQSIRTGTSHRAHMAMAAKLFSIPPSVRGAIVEAGCWKGGTTANLSLVADIVGRDLIVYDSFEGLPPPVEGDRWATVFDEGAFKGALEEVRGNVAAHGVIERCQFRKGWYDDTLRHHTEPIVLAFVDVDHQASMHRCVLDLWPHLVDEGYWFVDEYTRLDYCALFFSERYWRTYFDRPPPGLMGTGTGVAVGQHFVGPFRSMPPIQGPRSIGWTRKDFYGAWDYFPDDVPTTPLDGGRGSRDGAEGWTTTVVPSAERNKDKIEAAIIRAMERKAAETERGTRGDGSR